MLHSLFTTVHLNTISLITAIVCGLRALRSSKWFLASVEFFPAPLASVILLQVFWRPSCFAGSTLAVIMSHVVLWHLSSGLMSR